MHYAPSAEFDRGLADAERLISAVNPDVVIVSGDLTRDGLFDHFIPVVEFLRALGIERVRAIPGNRDYLGGGPGPTPPIDSDFDYFLDAPDTPGTGNRSDAVALTTPFTEFFANVDFFERRKDLALVGLNSEPQIPDESFRRGLAFLEGSSSKATRVFCTHRSLIPIPRKKLKPGDLLPNAGDVLAELVAAHVDLILCAHLHRVHVWQIGDGRHTSVVVNAPSLLDSSPGKENGFLMIDIPRRGELCVALHSLDGSDARTLIDTRISRKKRASAA